MGICTSCLEENKYHEKELKSSSFDDLKVFTFDGTITKAKIVEVNFKNFQTFHKHIIRIYHGRSRRILDVKNNIKHLA